MASASGRQYGLRAFKVPIFLAPAFAEALPSSRTTSSRVFSTSSSTASRTTTGPNKKRGVSAIRSTGFQKNQLRVYRYDLPQPVIDPARRAEFRTREDHGLWGFFNEAHKPMVSGEEEASHGRSWTYQELTTKNFNDLHSLYWTCILEVNRTNTRVREMARTRAGYGASEANDRIKTIKRTMRTIRRVLSDRYSNWTEARSLLGEKNVSEIWPERSAFGESEADGTTTP